MSYKDQPPVWGVAEFWSSVNPSEKVLMLAAGPDVIALYSTHIHFIRWMPEPQHIPGNFTTHTKPDSGRDAALAFEAAVPVYTRDEVDHPNDTGRKNWRSLEDDTVLKRCLDAALAAHPAPSSDAVSEVASAHGLLSSFCVGETKDGSAASLAQRITELYQWYYAATQPENDPINDEQHHAIATCINGGVEMGWVSDDMARAVFTRVPLSALATHPAPSSDVALVRKQFET